MNTNYPPPDDRQMTLFRRTVWLQVYVPLIACALLVVTLVAVGLAAGNRGGATTSGMADAALVALLLPVMVLGVVALAAIILLAVGIGQLVGWLPAKSRLVRRVVEQAPVLSDRIAGRAAQVIVAPKSVWAAVRAAWARLTAAD